MFLKIDYDALDNRADFSISHGYNIDDFDSFQTIASCTPDDWDKHYSLKNNLLPASVFPPAVRYISSDRKLVVLERPPTYKTVNYTQEYQDNLSPNQHNYSSYRIPIPWQVYVLYLSSEGRLANVFMFFRNSQIDSLTNDPLFYATLPNFYETGRLCQAAFDSIQTYDRDLLSSLNAASDMIWNSGFNKDTLLAFNTLFSGSYDLKNNPLAYTSRTTSSRYPGSIFEKWSRYLLSDVLNWTWPVAYPSLHDFIINDMYKHSIDPISHSFMVDILFAAQDSPQKNKAIS